MNARDIIDFCESKGYRIAKRDGDINIVYVEASDSTFAPVNNVPDEWNDLRIVISYRNGSPSIYFGQVATTEPGKQSTYSKSAKNLGGVARVKLGQYQSAFKVGYHKQDVHHPALVQSGPISVHRDSNQDFLRDGDPISIAAGINQHSTSPSFSGKRVGNYSAGCLVGRSWAQHLRFMEIVTGSRQFAESPLHKFDTIIISSQELNDFLKK